MWPPSQSPIGWTLIGIIIIIFFFLTFGSKLPIFPFLDIYPGPWMHHPTILTTTPIFFWFFPYFMPVFHREMHIGPWKQCPPSITTNPSLFFSDFFLYFIAIFHPEKHFFSIFGSVHWTLKQYPSITSNDNYPYFFCYVFAILLIFFMQHSRTFHIWKCALDPENHAQYGHQPSPILSLIFFLFYGYFIAIFHSA